jgi:hypothetical protein
MDPGLALFAEQTELAATRTSRLSIARAIFRRLGCTSAGKRAHLPCGRCPHFSVAPFGSAEYKFPVTEAIGPCLYRHNNNFITAGFAFVSAVVIAPGTILVTFF